MLGFLTALVRESVLSTEGVFGIVNCSFILRRLPGTLAGGLPRDLEARSHSALQSLLQNLLSTRGNTE